MDHPLMVSRRIVGERPMIGGTIGGRTITAMLPNGAPDSDVAEVESAVRTLLEKCNFVFSLNTTGAR